MWFSQLFEYLLLYYCCGLNTSWRRWQVVVVKRYLHRILGYDFNFLINKKKKNVVTFRYWLAILLFPLLDLQPTSSSFLLRYAIVHIIVLAIWSFYFTPLIGKCLIFNRISGSFRISIYYIHVNLIIPSIFSGHSK